jgi:hypothetical protein
MYYYDTHRHTETYSDVPPTLSTHKLIRGNDVMSFQVLRGGKVRIGNKIHSRAEARQRYSDCVSVGWRTA